VRIRDKSLSLSLEIELSPHLPPYTPFILLLYHIWVEVQFTTVWSVRSRFLGSDPIHNVLPNMFTGCDPGL
jgi:hypothetical protein